MKRARSIALCVKPGGKSPMMGWSSTCDPIREPRRRKVVALRSRVYRRISCHWRRAVPSQAPISLADARRQAHARPASSVGSQSLLLSKPYPHQRCGHPRTQRRSRLPRDLALRSAGILPATRYAVQAYVEFVSTGSHLEAVASSLTELFSKRLIVLRMDRLRQHYPWLSSGLDYFTGRLTQAPEDADFALAWVVKHANTREQQDLAHAALRAKCDILWAQLDALYFSYVNPAWPPPGAFLPSEKST